eukprot:NODE_2404_length_2218_cov_5.843615.p1 GENE.NODE_2404_length_2218_cov_5.843615~~NODE_2404_length_2218_cov_5.843615.p1  ORF type:complete len:612 (+),score=156.98 NODE_2404_length_2218_cov_5.843615:137-1972(+)
MGHTLVAMTRLQELHGGLWDGGGGGGDRNDASASDSSGEGGGDEGVGRVWCAQQDSGNPSPPVSAAGPWKQPSGKSEARIAMHLPNVVVDEEFMDSQCGDDRCDDEEKMVVTAAQQAFFREEPAGQTAQSDAVVSGSMEELGDRAMMADAVPWQSTEGPTQSCLLFWNHKGKGFEFLRNGSRARMSISGVHRVHPIRRLCLKLATSRYFDGVISILIFLNAIVIGISADQGVKNLDDGVTYMEPVHLFFSCAFFLELMVRVGGWGRRYFHPGHRLWAWNCLDLLVVGASVIEEVLSRVGNAGHSGGSILIIRLMRHSRFVRVLRVIRVMRCFAALRTAVVGILSSLKALFWCIILLFIFIFVFSVVIIEMVKAPLQEGTFTLAEHNAILVNFGSLLRAAYTLFSSVTAGIDWTSTLVPFVDKVPQVILVFSLYTAFTMFCVLNIFTGIIMDNAQQIIHRDTDHRLMSEMSQRAKCVDDLSRFFRDAETKGTGQMSLRTFQGYVADETMQAYFRSLGLDVTKESAMGLFQCIDFDGDGFVTLEEFVDGCLSVLGRARQLDLVRVKWQLGVLNKAVQSVLAQQRPSGEKGAGLPRDGGTQSAPGARETQNLIS